MKKLKPLIISSLLAAIIIVTPSISFAENNKLDNSSLWNRILNLIGNRASADNENSMPTINGITAPTVLKVGEMGTWTLKARDPNNGTLSYEVNWGDSSLSPNLKNAQIVPTQSTTFTHSYSHTGTYKITFTVTNNSGLKATSSVTVRVVDQNVANSPIIKNLNASSIRSNRVVIGWTTDTKSSSTVWYSKSSPVDISGTPQISRSGKVLNHRIQLNRLESNTKYYVIVRSVNSSGATTSQEISFTTLATVRNATPIITSIAGPKVITVGDTETVTINAYDTNNESLNYMVNWGDADTSSNSLKFERPVFVQSATFSHVYNSPGVYTATFTVENTSGKKSSSSIQIRVNPRENTER